MQEGFEWTSEWRCCSVCRKSNIPVMRHFSFSSLTQAVISACVAWGGPELPGKTMEFNEQVKDDILVNFLSLSNISSIQKNDNSEQIKSRNGIRISRFAARRRITLILEGDWPAALFQLYGDGTHKV